MLLIISFFLFITLSTIGSLYFYNKIKFEHFYFLSTQNFLKKKKTEYFSSHDIKRAVKVLLKQRNKAPILSFCFTRIEKSLDVLEKKPQIRNSIIAHFDIERALNNFLEESKEVNNLIYIAELHFYNNNQDEAKQIIEKVNFEKLSRYEKAKFLYLESYFDLQEGDLFSASSKLSASSQLFKKEKAFVEEARCFLLQGVALKTSGMFDTSQFIFETALKIFKNFDFSEGIVETYGNMGSLMSLQKRFEEADDYFDKAIENAKNKENDIYILAQKGLNKFLQGEKEVAKNLLLEVIKTSKISDNSKAQALGYEFMAYIKLEEKNFEKSISNAEKAIEKYQTLGNFSALLESKYIIAQSLFYMEELLDAEKVSREILEIAKNQQTSFHSSNCYNLLGLIFLKQGDHNRAKSLFQESVNLEQKNNRTKEIATDYFNMAMSEIGYGAPAQALGHLKTALEFAEKADEKKIIDLIQRKIEAITKH